jgi:hypothetical protein
MWLSSLSLQQPFILSNNYDDNLNSQSLVQFTSISLCGLIRVHSGQLSYLPVLALALSHTGFGRMHLYVISIDTSIDNQLLLRTIDMINTIVRRVDYITLLDVGTSDENDYGFTLTDRALTYLYHQYEHSPSTCQYVILTNGDNFYSRELGKNVLPHMYAKKDIIAWNFVSRYYWPDSIKVSEVKNQTTPKIVDTGKAKCIPVSMRVGHADLGTVAYRVAFLKQHGLHIHYPNGTYDAWSDGFFVQIAASLTNASVILRQTLYVHQ